MSGSKLIPVAGEPQEIAPKNGKLFTVEELHELVGGYFEIACQLRNGSILVVNEEGRRMNYVRNEQATMLYRTCVATGWDIVGDAVLIAKGEFD